MEGDPAQLGLALRQVAALQFWQGYAALDAAYRSWKSDAGAALLSRGSDGPDGGGASLRVHLGNSFEVAVARGEALAGRLLRLAAEDRLGVLVAPGDDAAAGGEDPARVRLLVVAAGGEAGADEYRSAVDARTLRLQLEQALASLTSSCPDLEASVSTPAADDDADEDDADEADLPSGDETLLLLDRGGREQRRRRGVVVVRLASAAAAPPPGAPEHEALRLHHKAGRAWEAMAAKAAWLLGGARREAAGGGGEGEGGGQGGGGGAPRLVVVSLGASFSTAAQIARHRTTAKLLTRVAKVLLALTRVGHYSAPLSAELAELAAGARAPPGGGSLADLLAPRDARRLLRLMAAALEEAPPGPGAVLV
ncbi:hypothetical protein MNEG_11273 [Monoraphidium neglectum]|uniref:Uncharacterized protein n=1 Tax=Monoraphidium neglectum TaxID=145388 RepID=A0A0D2JAC4_9CHLO|nr:hypothetical protein MNEG_11273 [Monoraphidium neglectum]KIY96692.1 hypothetical protein MNEG_11273 [Monoraphidium neglectum]|eukprot:XP_013895712.1 hypothetical protein MNEG_11273 [Monoraphidium neglectum]